MRANAIPGFLKAFALILFCLQTNPLAETVDDAGFTIRQVLSSPFPYSLAASPENGRIAWVINREGVRNIWVAQAPGFEARQLTQFEHDDGHDIQIMGLSPKGDYVVFVRGEGFNPDHDADGPMSPTLFALGWGGGIPRKIGESATAAVSPVADEVAFVKNGGVWLSTLSSAEKRQQLAQIRGSLGQLRWSPDGSHLALSTARGEYPDQYAFIVDIEIAHRRVKYWDSSVHFDGSPAWSADGRKLAFIRRLTSNHRWNLNAKTYPEVDPWEIRVADLETGEVKRAWKSPEDGSFYQSKVDWLDGERLIFASEKDGFRHLYSVRVGGGEVKQLTKGQFEVEDFVTVPQLRRAIFTCNKDDIDRRHIWSVESGQLSKPLTLGTSIEWSPVPVGSTQVAYLGSDAVKPAGVYVTDLNGQSAKQLAVDQLPEDFPERQLTVPEQVVFEAADGLKIHGQLFHPPQRFRGPRPAVLFFHGGPIRQMLLGWHYGGYYHRFYGANQYLASQGYVVLSVNYRLGIGYGRKFRDVPDGGPRGGSEYQDLLAAAKYLRSLEEVDESRIGLWGGSYGGLMTALGLARNSDLFAAGVDFHGVHDWNRWQAWSAQEGNDQDLAAWKSSPVADLDTWISPVLLIHADDDRNVPFSETVWLVRELAKRGVEHEVLVFPDDVHGFLLHRNWITAFERSFSFFEKQLGQAAE